MNVKWITVLSLLFAADRLFVPVLTVEPNQACRPQSSRNRTDFQVAAILPELLTTPNPDNKKHNWLFAKERISPAIDIALESVRRDQILSGVNITVRYANDRAESRYALRSAINYYLNGEVDVFFGPILDYALAPIARQSMFWNIPIMTSGGMAADFQKERQTMYPMLTRISASFNSLAKSFRALFTMFEWDKVKLMYDKEG